RDRILAQAQEEAARTLAIAREKSEQLVERDSIVQAAKSRAKQIEQEGYLQAEKTRVDADQYVIETLLRLEEELERSLIQARNGIRALQMNQQEDEEYAEMDDEEDFEVEQS
ncbi:MAG: hypothetical protein GWN61_05615, partial [candidate division Zixibacteria bacterium]|nr:hypothetical protein [candidate division Zixibacteria bacterium]NIS45502.1 hypothetical protein [candidate division Zixibacteria bacterium]NIU13634.1 hypothetical protein [candidate division Zixibacteria bacterium]NIV05669.1 hypothetical protein [candidate division Zixibacteria bacterium]NIW44508.1 hypothetical protein [Gammaproteobacteria bacterium]